MANNDIHQLLVESKQRISKYDDMLNEAERTFRELNSRNMQATLIQIEDFFDSNNLYAFNNWFEGIVWDGPNITKYWIELTLKYTYESMPEPVAMNRFSEMGVQYDFVDTIIMKSKKVQNPDDLDPVTRKPKEEKERIWLVSLKIPRHLVEDPMPDDSEDVDNVQNLEATANAEEEAKGNPDMEEADDMTADDGASDEGGDELDL